MLDPMQINDGIIAVKHGNGRDWWLIYKHGFPQNDSMCQSVSITQWSLIATGSANRYFHGVERIYRMSINPAGDLIAGVTVRGVIELFDFDRCTGLLSNHRYLKNNLGTNDEKERFWSVEFSGSSRRYLYVSPLQIGPCYLYQFDSAKC
jgi:hypothetical protein